MMKPLPIWFVVVAVLWILAIVAAMVHRHFGPFGKPDPDAGLLDWPELGLRGRVGGACPIQGDGTIGDHCFTFFAQNDAWTFEVFEGHRYPWDIPDEEGVFHREGEAVGSSYMAFDESREIVRDCARQFLEGRRPPA